MLYMILSIYFNSLNKFLLTWGLYCFALKYLIKNNCDPGIIQQDRGSENQYYHFLKDISITIRLLKIRISLTGLKK